MLGAIAWDMIGSVQEARPSKTPAPHDEPAHNRHR